jgi:NAD(P)-dependent dehydrogenase (short-subunit alcohol dehydrogenase family)
MILKDKVVIVTGGSGLLGSSFVDDLKNEGAITINTDINVETNLSKGLVKVDITSTNSIEDAVVEIINHYGKIDGLVNNAYPRTKDWGTKFEDILPESWSKNVEMQMNSYVFFCQKVLRYMTKQQFGSIVNIASIYGVVGNDFSIYENTKIGTAAEYSAIKGGVINFSRYLASYYGKRGIRVNVVSPGGIFDHQDPKFVENYNNKCPMGRMGNPDDISPAVAFLLSDKAKYITGQNLIVDGGWTAI